MRHVIGLTICRVCGPSWQGVYAIVRLLESVYLNLIRHCAFVLAIVFFLCLNELILTCRFEV